MHYVTTLSAATVVIDEYEHGLLVEWNWKGKPEVRGEKPDPVPLCPPQIPNGWV